MAGLNKLFEMKQGQNRLFQLGAPTAPHAGARSTILGDIITGLDERKLAAWNKAIQIPNSDYRIDCDNRYILWAEYGKRSAHGWEVDHIVPKAVGGSDDLSNFQARHWFGNASAGGKLGSLAKALGSR